jgi:hypothetical protein
MSAPVPTSAAVIDPDGALDVGVVTGLTRNGVRVERFADATSMLAASQDDPPSWVLVGCGVDPRQARAATRKLRADPDAPPVAWWSRHPHALAQMSTAERPEAGLWRATDDVSLAGLIWRTTHQPLLRDNWSGVDMLPRVPSDPRRYPLLRMLHLTWRVEASGELSQHAPGQHAVISLRGGKVVGVRGMPELLAAVGVSGGPDDDMMTLVGRAIAAGTRADEALDRAAEGLGRALAALLATGAGAVWFNPGVPVATVPLSMTVPRLVAHGLSATRSLADVTQALAPLWSCPVSPNPPRDSPPERWGLDSLAHGVLRSAEGGARLDAVVGQPPRPEAVLAVDQLLSLGFLRLGEPEIPVTRPQPLNRSQTGSLSRSASRDDLSSSGQHGRARDRAGAARLPRPAAPAAPAAPHPPAAAGSAGQSGGNAPASTSFDIHFLGIQALARDGTTDPQDLVRRILALRFPEGARGADAASVAGEIALTLGDKSAAVRLFETALLRHPGHANAKRRLQSRELRSRSVSDETSITGAGDVDNEVSLGSMIEGWLGRWRS